MIEFSINLATLGIAIIGWIYLRHNAITLPKGLN